VAAIGLRDRLSIRFSILFPNLSSPERSCYVSVGIPLFGKLWLQHDIMGLISSMTAWTAEVGSAHLSEKDTLMCLVPDQCAVVLSATLKEATGIVHRPQACRQESRNMARRC
jgi:hypothetical protein